MIALRWGMAVTILCAAAPAALLGSAPAQAKNRGGGGYTQNVPVGPLWTDTDAERKCARAARDSGGTWTGQWKKARPGVNSTCEIRMSGGGGGGGARGGRTIEVGPIWNQQDAEVKCSKAARKQGLRWTGQWWTTKPGRMSVCQVSGKGGGYSPYPTPDPRFGPRMVEVGPIWNQQDAERKCTAAAREISGRWTGQWKTTRPGQMSVCEIGR